MRIQHNILAMNAYRNYNTNTSALSKNLEKLSSGYKINRAGDDAAGLAISEKMRAQITGLNAAQKNVKDGISLVKTAEGAMQEIQDMLNRMDYLATQSANGTYDDPVDRLNLQKEVDALKTEIDRIAESANFNGIKLLDGSLDPESTGAASNAAADKAAQAAQAVTDAQKALDDLKAAGAEQAAPVFGESMTADEVIDIMLPQEGTGPSSADKVGTNTILETEKVEFQSPSFQVSMDGVTYTMATNGTGDDNGIDFDAEGMELTIGTQSFTLTEEDMQAYLTSEKGMAAADVKAGTTLNGEDLAGAIAYKINKAGAALVGATTNGNATADPPTAGIIAGSTTDNRFGDGTNAWKVRADGQNVVFEFDEDINVRPTTAQNKYFDTKIDMDGTPTAADVKATAGTQSFAVTDGSDGGGTATTGDAHLQLKATIDGKEVTFAAQDITGDVTAANVKTAVDAAAAVVGTDDEGNEYKLTDYFDISRTGQNIIFTDKTKGAAGSGNTVTLTIDTSDQTIDTGNGGTAGTIGTAVTTKGADAYTAGLNGYINAGTEVVIPGLPSESEQLASTTLDFSDFDIVDGMKVTLGNESYIFAVGKDSKFKDAAGEGVKVVDLTDVEDADDLLSGGDQDTRNLALSRLTEAAKGNDVFTVSHETNGTPQDQIGLKQLQSAKADTDMSTMEGFASYIDIQTVDADATAAAQAVNDQAFADKVAELEQAVEDAKAAQTEADSAADAAADEVGKPLTLQIGDTSDKFNQMEVSVGDMHVAAMGTMTVDEKGNPTHVVDGAENSIANVDISSLEGAQKAIDVIKNAINYVSGVRGDLGATQNRLEHTANNLSVMTENIQDAESTIRDTDIAEEMMAYTKNNILVQSAQAMLAQANAVPQGVLQLLG